MNVKSHVEPFISQFLGEAATGGASETDVTVAATDYVNGWDSCISHIVDFVHTSGEVPKLLRKTVAKKLEEARPAMSVLNPTVTDKPADASDAFVKGWNAALDYLLAFVNDSGEVPKMFHGKLIPALTETRI